MKQKFFRNKLYRAKNGTIFMILNEDYDHHKAYTEYQVKILEDKGDFATWYFRDIDVFWIKQGGLIAREPELISDNKAIEVLYG